MSGGVRSFADAIGDWRPLTTWDDNIEYQLERGLTADEIVDLFDHWALTGEMSTRSGEWLDWGLIHGRRRILALIATTCGESSTPDDSWWTPWRMDKATRYRDAVRWLRRNGGASVAGAARRAGADRGTLAEWIKAGKLERPEDVSER